ncbi:MAG TPA: ABC transporter ATP-binding protein [Vicinamibacterales bacterium]|nr:ABC transporter ATP-binding protein [Vicinamibacterales bacterium]
MSANAVEIRGLEKKFPAFELGPLDLTVPRGAIYGFVGPNGSGKTTTIDLIFGMGTKDAGTITVLGLDHLRDEVAMKRQVAYVSPDLQFQPWGRIHKVVQFVRGFYPSWDEAYCGRLMRTLDLNPSDRIMTLSFGARIKLALVLALSWRPKVLILDEPTVGLDAISRQAVFAELLAAVQDDERTVLISSHGLDDVERFADHVGMIKNGRLLFEGATVDVIARFRIVDVVAPEAVRFGARPGIVVQRQDGQRWRLLIDRQRATLESLRALGVTLVAEAPVTLEELFVALGKA